MSYVIQFDDLKEKACEEIKDFLNKNSGKKSLNDLKLRDLVFDGENPISSANGAYIFYEGEKPLYVGRCKKKSFIERIPSNLDSRIGAWQNSYVKGLQKKQSDCSLSLDDVASLAFQKTSLLLINLSLSDVPQYASPIEDALFYFLKPSINSVSDTKLNKINKICKKLPNKTFGELVKVLSEKIGG